MAADIKSVGPVINDSNWQNYYAQGFRGYHGMYQANSSLLVKPLAEFGIPIIPESDWDDVIREQQKEKSTIRDMCNDMKLPHKDQKRTNFCWIFGPTHCCEFLRLKETGRVISYSPASGGAIIKNFRNVGGWGDQAVEFFIENGLNYSSDWPDTAIDRKYHTSENTEKKKLHKTIEWASLDSWVEVGSCILAGFMAGVGYNWWSHLVAATGIFLGAHDLEIRNSWAGWGENGFGTLSGNRKIPDGAVAPITMTPL